MQLGHKNDLITSNISFTNGKTSNQVRDESFIQIPVTYELYYGSLICGAGVSHSAGVIKTDRETHGLIMAFI